MLQLRLSFLCLAIAIGQESSVVMADIEDRVIGGTNAEKGEISYITLLTSVSPAGNPTICGGALLSRIFVLTAAHCICPGKNLTVMVGSIYKRPPASERGSYQTFNVTPNNIFVHENYSLQTIKNDVAIVKLPSAVSSNLGHVAPVMIPCYKYRYLTFAGQESLIAGWGRTSDDKRTASDILQVATLHIMSNAECASYFKNLSYPITEGQICTKNEGSTTCTGDSGGPLTVMSNDGYGTMWLVGVVSFGTAFCNSGYPTVYSRVGHYVDWIEKITGLEIRCYISS